MYLCLFGLVGAVMYLQTTAFRIENYDMITLAAGSLLYFIFSYMKLIYLKKPLNTSEIFIATLIMFLVGLFQKVLAGWLYPEADANDDRLVTRKEYEDWKRK